MSAEFMKVVELLHSFQYTTSLSFLSEEMQQYFCTVFDVRFFYTFFSFSVQLHFLQPSCCFIITEKSTARVAKFNPSFLNHLLRSSQSGGKIVYSITLDYYYLFIFTFLIFTFLDNLVSLVPS